MKTQLGLLILRAAPAVFMLTHGFTKLIAYSTLKDTFPDPIGAGSQISLVLTIFAEFICAALLALGLFTRFATIPLIITMVVATFVIHAGDPFQKRELALLYLACFTSALLLGPGKWSLDYFVRKKL